MTNAAARGLASAAAAVFALADCTLLPSAQPVFVAPADTTIGSVVPVYNPPPNTPFHCVGTPVAITLFNIPDDPNDPLPITTAPVATMGNRRGDWLLVVTHTGEIGWLDDPQEESYAQEYPGRWCHVHQDAQGRIVFDYKLVHGMY
jgi:hypothetical protein